MTEQSSPIHFKSGYVAIVGAPNAGKSTLTNRLLGQKIAITSRRPQTTRNRVLGVVHRPAAQMILLDTPGVHHASQPLNRRSVQLALSVLADVDLVIFMVDAAQPDPDAEALLLGALRKQTRPVLLAINKIDRLAKPKLLFLIDKWSKRFDFVDIIPVSAKRGTQLPQLVTAVETRLPVGPPLFPPDMITDLSERFIAAEMIREKTFRLTGQEIPYAVAVTVESFKVEKEGALARIQAVIHVERESQKGIIIGKKGAKLRQIGEAARREIERMTGTRVFLKLFVRVQKNWTRDSRALRRFGY